jgi:hypothetical protein
MKYIISESKYNNFIYDYLCKLFPEDKINFGNPMTDWDEQTEDENRVEFWFGVGRDEDLCFKWYGCDYFVKDALLKQFCPFVVLENDYENKLNLLFQDSWKSVFIKWFKDKFNLPIKRVIE